jgi:threonylcarbamoyladenosine tRNA methylthiotransferase MtaB
MESWSRKLAAMGCEIAQEPAQADLCIVNSCTVTHVAAQKSRQIVRRCARGNPQAKIVLTGCYARISPTEASQLPGVSLLGTADKEHLIEDVSAHSGIRVAEAAKAQNMGSLHTRTLVKIQDGCDNSCTYCVVRIARGKHRSRPLQDVLEEVAAREAEGYQEIVLTGIHIGAYGREHNATLAGLVQTILRETRFPRLRLSSVEPWDLSQELLQLWENPRLCRHLHLPLQSGCDATLQRMNRRYSAAQFEELVRAAREAIPDLAVTTDVIVGFPGEDEREFSDSRALVSRLGFARIHVFPFSPRPGTIAADLPHPVSTTIARQRVTQMSQIAHQCDVAFRRRFLGRTLNVLWETQKGSVWRGLTDNYCRVEVVSTAAMGNCLLPTRLVELTDKGIRGELASTPVGFDRNTKVK